MAIDFLAIYPATLIVNSVIELNRAPSDRLTSIGFGNRKVLHMYIELTTVPLFRLGESVPVICYLAADYTIIMSKILEVMG